MAAVIMGVFTMHGCADIFFHKTHGMHVGATKGVGHHRFSGSHFILD